MGGGESVREESVCLEPESMASLTLKNIKKIYPFNGDEEKEAKKKKKKKHDDEPEKEKANLQVTEQGVVAVQQFSLDVADKEFCV